MRGLPHIKGGAIFMFKNLKPVQRLIIEELMKRNNKGFVLVTQEQIAENIGVCRRTVLRHLLKLEQMEFNGYPLIKRIQRRRSDGKYETTIYILEWMEDYQEATRKEQQAIIDSIINETYEELETSHVTKGLNYITITYNIKNTVSKLAKKMELKPSHIIRCLANVGYMLNEKANIYHLDKYIAKTFKEMGIRLKAEDSIKEMYPALINLI